MGTTTDDLTAWRVYANVLELLTTTLWLNLILSGFGAVWAAAATDGDPGWVLFGLSLGGVAWPVMFGLRSQRVRRWLDAGG